MKGRSACEVLHKWNTSWRSLSTKHNKINGSTLVTASSTKSKSNSWIKDIAMFVRQRGEKRCAGHEKPVTDSEGENCHTEWFALTRMHFWQLADGSSGACALSQHARLKAHQQQTHRKTEQPYLSATTAHGHNRTSITHPNNSKTAGDVFTDELCYQRWRCQFIQSASCLQMESRCNKLTCFSHVLYR